MFVRYARPLAGASLVAGVLLFAGCPTPPKASRVTPLSPAGFPAVVEPNIETVMVTGEPQLQPLLDHRESILPEEALQLPAGMAPLSSWARLCGFSEVRLVPNTVPQVVELQSDEGVLGLTFGQRFARWNGVNLGLGYAPAIRKGEFFLNSVDVQKNVYPLALGRFSISKESRVLMLDPGHGGADPGSRCNSRSCSEKDLALDWALRIERLLADSSWRVVLTRREDRDVSLMERVALADAHKADVFLSLHFNALEQSGSSREETGIETYCLTPAGLPSNITRSFEDDPRRVYPNNEFDAENLLLATRLHSSLVQATGQRDRGVRRARFMTVLREQKRPAVLIEGGFLSSVSESKLIVDPAYRERMAQAVCAALLN